MSMRTAARSAAVGLSVILLSGACGRGGEEATTPGSAGDAGAAADQGAPTLEELKNASYAGLEDLPQPITLEDGVWEGAPYTADSPVRPRVNFVLDLRATGDLDADGDDEAAVLLNLATGGTGQFLHVAAVDRVEGALRNIGTAFIGDRVQVRAFRIESGRILIDVVRAGPEDAACCPGETATLGWEWRPEGGLSAVQVEGSTGRLALESIAGAGWVLRKWAWEEEAPTEPPVTLRLEEGRFAGSAGCNNYFTTPQEGEMPGEITVGPIGATRMSCPEPAMLVEARYLGQLERVRRYGFLGTQLALTYEHEGGVGVMLFERQLP